MYAPYATLAEQAARTGGRILLEKIGQVKIQEKAPRDLVTEADTLSQHVIRDILLNAYPDHEFIGEEGGFAVESYAAPSTGFRWIVDPLDGTANYAHQLPGFAVSIGLEHAGQVVAGVVFDPVARECYVAARGEGAFLNGSELRVSTCRRLADALVAASFPANVTAGSPEIPRFQNVLLAAQSLRRLGSAALNLCYVASGRMDAYWATNIKPWDVAAGALMITEAGGVLTGIDGGEFQLMDPPFAAAATHNLHAELVQALKYR